MEKTDKIRKTIFEYHAMRRHYAKAPPFKILVSAILSQRTRDRNTEIATERLFNVASDPAGMSKIGAKRLEHLIKESGFYRRKSRTLRRLCRMLEEKYYGRVPSSRELLLSLPGVGYKTADMVLLYAYGVETIPVDVHVEVVSKRLGLVPQNAKYEEIGAGLEKIFPGKERLKINSGMVQFGQTVCLTAKPKCYMCPLVGVCVYDKKNLVPPNVRSNSIS